MDLWSLILSMSSLALKADPCPINGSQSRRRIANLAYITPNGWDSIAARSFSSRCCADHTAHHR